MEKKNPEKFKLENETKKIQEEYISEMKADKGIVDVVDAIATDIDIEAITNEKNDLELERLKEQKRIKAGDRINYFMIDNDEQLREISFKFPSTRVIMGLSEYGVSGDGRLFLDLTKSIEVLQANKLFITKFDMDDFCQEELEGFGGFLMNILRNPRKFIQNLSK